MAQVKKPIDTTQMCIPYDVAQKMLLDLNDYDRLKEISKLDKQEIKEYRDNHKDKMKEYNNNYYQKQKDKLKEQVLFYLRKINQN